MEEYSIKHGEVKRAFEERPCVDLAKDEVLECIADRLTSLGYRIVSTTLWTLFAEPTGELNDARFVRVEARHSDEPIKHVFTFALLKAKGKFRVVFAQSAVIV